MMKKSVCVFGSPSTVQQEKSISLVLPMCSDFGLVCEQCKLFSCYDCISKIYAAIKDNNLQNIWYNNVQSYIECKPVGVYHHKKGHCCKYNKKQEKLTHHSLCDSNQQSCNEGSSQSQYLDPYSTSNICQPRQRKESKIYKKKESGTTQKDEQEEKAHIPRTGLLIWNYPLGLL